MQYCLTVLIPVLNGLPYLTDALRSLEAQTFRYFEVFLWDNGSTDGTLEEAKKWIPSRISGRIISDAALPLHECLARMVVEAKSEFCARMDADDVCHPTRFSRQLKEFACDPHLLVLGSQAGYIDSDGNETGGCSNFPIEYCDILSGLLVENQLLHPTVMFRREAILNAGNYTAEKPCEDYDLWLRVAASGAVRNLADTLLSYRQHSKSIISMARSMDQLRETNLRCMDHHCKEMFGISPEVYRKLRSKESSLSMVSLISAVIRIASRSGVPVLRVLNSPYFLYSARCLTAKSDLVSRTAWGLFQRTGRFLAALH